MTDQTTTESATPSKRGGRRPLGDRPMTPAERQRRSRERRRYPAEGYSGKQIELMLSGEAHCALDQLRKVLPRKKQKEIVEMAILALAQAYKAEIDAMLDAELEEWRRGQAREEGN